MGKGKISLVRLYSGEHVIGEETGRENGGPVLANPREISLVPSMGGQVGLAFRPVCMFGEKCKKELSLRIGQVMVEVPEDELPKELVNGYLSEVSGIAVASSVPDVSGKPKAGSFSL